MFISLGLIGGLILLDKYAFGEFGFSQPLVVCPLIGMLFGATEAGLLLGILLQMLFFSDLPLGRSITPDSQAGAVLGISCFVLLNGRAPDENLLTFSYLIGILGSILATYPDILVRKLSNQFYHRFMKRGKDYLKLHLLGLLLVYLKNSLFLVVMLLIITIFGFLPTYFRIDQNVLILTSVSVGAANAIYLFYKRAYMTYILAGAIIGCLYQFFVK